MVDKPRRAADYPSNQVERVRALCLYIGTRLGDLMDDLVVVGGLVPSLLIDTNATSTMAEQHVGTMDLDLGLTLAVLDDGRYRSLTQRLRDAGFVMDQNAEGRSTRQRWRIGQADSITVDFLVPPSVPTEQGGRLRNFEQDFAAIVTPGLHLAFIDRRQVVLQGRTTFGEKTSRSVWVCGAGAFTVLKALAFAGRGDHKDAYDLYYLLRNYGAGVEDVAGCLGPLLSDPSTVKAMAILFGDFIEHDAVGPLRVADFITGGPDETIQADVVGVVTRLLALCQSSR